MAEKPENRPVWNAEEIPDKNAYFLEIRHYWTSLKACFGLTIDPGPITLFYLGEFKNADYWSIIVPVFWLDSKTESWYSNGVIVRRNFLIWRLFARNSSIC